MTKPPTEAMLSALKWLRNRGGDGVQAERHGNVLHARGERAAVMSTTWLRLENAGLIERYDKRRRRVTFAGRAIDVSGVRECDCAEVVHDDDR